MLQYFRTPALSEAAERDLISKVNAVLGEGVVKRIFTEWCYYAMPIPGQALSVEKTMKMDWLLSETFQPENFGDASFLGGGSEGNDVIEVGPRLSFETPWDTNASQILNQCGIKEIERIERSRRYLPVTSSGVPLDQGQREAFLRLVHDRMTEQPYPKPLETFKTGMVPEPVREIPIIQKGRAALDEASVMLGLGLDEFDKNHIMEYFTRIGRNPTDVELFQYGQANSEHSRHAFFNAKIIIDGNVMPMTLMQMIKEPFVLNPGSSMIAFKDNASVNRGFPITLLAPNIYYDTMVNEWTVDFHITFNAETHNFPSAIAAYPGAETGVGGRLRDDMGPGRGGYTRANSAGYAVGSLMIDGYPLPWERVLGQHPSNIMFPRDILIQASNGASDYGNKFGIALINGFVRSLDIILETIDGYEHRSWIKPIMFTGGIGGIREEHLEKKEPKKGMHLVLLGGRNYRIGLGGGSASSMGLGDNREELDYNAVQRGDAEMEQRVLRVIMACLDMGADNPILSIHDLGAGGNCNALPEICLPAGGKIFLNRLPLGDETLSALEIWGNESQERMALLTDDEGLRIIIDICEREKCPFVVAGVITGDGKIVVEDERDGSRCVDMEMSFALGDIPQKTFKGETIPVVRRRLFTPRYLTFREALGLVLRHPDVASKQFLTVKADRSVGGYVVVQQCCGPFHLPVSDYGLILLSHFEDVGASIAVGQVPVIGLLDNSAMARMSIGEAITNIMFSGGGPFEEVFLCTNAMWAAKKPGEAANIYEAYTALRDIQIALGIRTDGGKDSLSMSAVCKDLSGNDEDVKAPGTLVISARVPSSDVSIHATPDLKEPGRSSLMHIDFSGGKRRLGGSVFARVLEQLGSVPPDLDDPDVLRRGYNAVHELLARDFVLAGHDISDGGIAVTLSEMAISGGCGMDVFLSRKRDLFHTFFSEELGIVIEFLPENEREIMKSLDSHGLCGFYSVIGETRQDCVVRFFHGKTEDDIVLKTNSTELRQTWESTSFALDRLQSNPETVAEEMKGVPKQKPPRYRIPFSQDYGSSPVIMKHKPSVAVIREEGTNADSEMRSALYLAGFEVHDVTMTDIFSGRVSLDAFNMVVFPGGFSFADVLDAGKGWAGGVLFNERAKEEFERFYGRDDTLSFGVCNGCQMMALLGWVPWKGIEIDRQPRFIRNTSGRFESRFPTVTIGRSPSMMLQKMEGLVFGIWVRHGEGRFFCHDESILEEVIGKQLAPIRYSNYMGRPTEAYPDNPNGSVLGIAGITTPDGRHLAMMPHPEALFMMEQFPWIPREWKNLKESPWFMLFKNAMAAFD